MILLSCLVADLLPWAAAYSSFQMDSVKISVTLEVKIENSHLSTMVGYKRYLFQRKLQKYPFLTEVYRTKNMTEINGFFLKKCTEIVLHTNTKNKIR